MKQNEIETKIDIIELFKHRLEEAGCVVKMCADLDPLTYRTIYISYKNGNQYLYSVMLARFINTNIKEFNDVLHDDMEYILKFLKK